MQRWALVEDGDSRCWSLPLRASSSAKSHLLVLCLILLVNVNVHAFQSPSERFQHPTTKLWARSVDPLEQQISRAPQNRKPNYYWNDIENVRRELVEFWKNVNITSFPQTRPPIPSEALLSHFERYDLRRVIAKYGGRSDLSYDLGGVEVIPGKWKDAVRDSLIVQELLQNESHGLRPDVPPLSPQQKKAFRESADGTLISRVSATRWSYKCKAERRPIKYWSLGKVVESLYEHLDEIRDVLNRPAVWMPRPAEIREGREDLFHAIARFGGAKEIAEIAGLVAYHEWRYFDGQLELMKALTLYLDERHGGDRMFFPTCTEIKESGCMSLYYAIQRYGGRKFLMSRFGMEAPKRSHRSYLEMSFGPFSLDFAIDLLEYIRNDHMERKAPLKPAVIRMPTEYVLFQQGRSDLIDGIQKYGGYENVARRLGLAHFDAIPPSKVNNNVGRR
ncbi:hypothetical protein MHU86_13308 [Fragilaria crotonensis]|nr:hypothetical protein MHU86_13308 [Fragilaria crotonensis]